MMVGVWEKVRNLATFCASSKKGCLGAGRTNNYYRKLKKSR